MIRQGIIIDPHTKFEIIKECNYDDIRIDGMYVKANGELLPAAYVYPIENRDKVLEALNSLKLAKKQFDDLQANIFYKVFPTLR